MVDRWKGSIMKDLCTAANGQAARKSGQETGLENELKMLLCIMSQRWVRENELQLITGMSKYTVGQVSRRLAERNQISRAREFGNAGYFLRLLPAGAERISEKLGKGVTIPKSWKHDAMAIQTLHFLADKHNAKFETDASVRRHIKAGKFPDGRLIADNQVYYFEQERARKSGGICASKPKQLPCWPIRVRFVSSATPILQGCVVELTMRLA